MYNTKITLLFVVWLCLCTARVTYLEISRVQATSPNSPPSSVLVVNFTKKIMHAHFQRPLSIAFK